LPHGDSNSPRLGANRAGLLGRGWVKFLTIPGMVLVGTEDSKLGAVLPRHASTAPLHGGRAMLHLARAALRPPVASHPSRGPCAAPLHPTPKGVPPLDTCPTVRRLDARQRRVPLHRQSGSLAPRYPRVGLSRPTPRQGTRPGSLTLPNRAPVGYAPACAAGAELFA